MRGNLPLYTMRAGSCPPIQPSVHIGNGNYYHMKNQLERQVTEARAKTEFKPARFMFMRSNKQV